MSQLARIQRFLQRHPSVRDALLWVIPALLVGGFLRLCLLHYNPYAYWGSDSRSYFDFTYKLFAEHYISLVEKRRFLYPIFTAFVSLLPGAPLKWLAWVQHGFGLATLVPLAYVIRKTFAGWRWWIIPVTIIYAGMPVILWYEHELLAENIFFALVVWSFAGWVGWASAERLARARQLWWWFFVPFTLFILTKPSGRFYWPGIFVGLVLVKAWSRLSRAQLAGLFALIIVTLFVGSKKQGAWLLYTATFPLTQTETPLHAEYKAEIHDKVAEYRQSLDLYYTQDDWPFSFLENPSKQTEFPLWHDLERSEKKAPLYMDLAKEGVIAHPDLFLYLGFQRLVASANVSDFKEMRFRGSYYPDRIQNDYEGAVALLKADKPTSVPMAFGYGKQGPLPSYEELSAKVSPVRDSLSESIVTGWVENYERFGDLVYLPKGSDGKRQKVTVARPTFLGWWLLASIVLAALPAYRKTYGVWTLGALGYLCGVFLVSQVNVRYFGAAWPVLLPLLAVPLDFLFSLGRRERRVDA